MVGLTKLMGVYKLLIKDNKTFFSSRRIKEPTTLFLKLIIIFVPTFLIALFIDKMVFVLPTLAIGLLLGTGIDGPDTNSKDNEESDNGDS